MEREAVPQRQSAQPPSARAAPSVWPQSEHERVGASRAAAKLVRPVHGVHAHAPTKVPRCTPVQDARLCKGLAIGTKRALRRRIPLLLDHKRQGAQRAFQPLHARCARRVVLGALWPASAPMRCPRLQFCPGVHKHVASREARPARQHLLLHVTEVARAPHVATDLDGHGSGQHFIGCSGGVHAERWGRALCWRSVCARGKISQSVSQYQTSTSGACKIYHLKIYLHSSTSLPLVLIFFNARPLPLHARAVTDSCSGPRRGKDPSGWGS